MTEKVKFKDYPTIHKILLSSCYGFIALSALLTAHAVKNNRNFKNPACALGTTLFVTPLYRAAIHKEVYQTRQE